MVIVSPLKSVELSKALWILYQISDFVSYQKQAYNNVNLEIVL